ncbi:Serine/threonine protein Kinase [Phytophthora cinnamomi]|uniref:Serine/threonine protein Kinase n=1 Tax=Phytophthora cinnamomi TaxID=4785 RepID=UPI00355A3FBE|nr:Serine/threonine protein Kinase [Phytophthora cinnamomi]
MLRGQFTFHAKLHETLFGDIWLCHDRQNDNRTVAVKQVHLDRVRDAVTRDLQLDSPFAESQTLEVLRMLGPHDNILQVHEQFLHDDSWFAVMEYCEGGDLWQNLQREPHNRLPEQQALALFAQVVHGVRLLHANGVAHRDLSLENVLLGHGRHHDGDGASGDNDGGDGGEGDDGEIVVTPKICDFGLSTKTNRVCRERVGKAYYMAPEVVAGIAYDPRAADVWSLGIMLFVMLTGSPLTPLASPKEKAFVALKDFGVRRILDAWHMGDMVSLVTVHLLVGMLQIDPAVRFTVEDVATHLALAMH